MDLRAPRRPPPRPVLQHRVIHRIEAQGAFVLVIDVTAAVDAMVERVAAGNGRLDYLFNNAFSRSSSAICSIASSRR